MKLYKILLLNWQNKSTIRYQFLKLIDLMNMGKIGAIEDLRIVYELIKNTWIILSLFSRIKLSCEYEYNWGLWKSNT